MPNHSLPTILLVDDEPNVLRGYRDVFRKEPYEVLLAGSASEALQLLARNEVDVLVADERMPWMSGSELLKRVHRDYPDVVRIMLTGQASLEASVQAINDGLYRFLNKPIAADELRRVMHDALHVKSLSWPSASCDGVRQFSEGGIQPRARV